MQLLFFAIVIFLIIFVCAYIGYKFGQKDQNENPTEQEQVIYTEVSNTITEQEETAEISRNDPHNEIPTARVSPFNRSIVNNRQPNLQSADPQSTPRPSTNNQPTLRPQNRQQNQNNITQVTPTPIRPTPTTPAARATSRPQPPEIIRPDIRPDYLFEKKETPFEKLSENQKLETILLFCMNFNSQPQEFLGFLQNLQKHFEHLRQEQIKEYESTDDFKKYPFSRKRPDFSINERWTRNITSMYQLNHSSHLDEKRSLSARSFKDHDNYLSFNSLAIKLGLIQRKTVYYTQGNRILYDQVHHYEDQIDLDFHQSLVTDMSNFLHKQMEYLTYTFGKLDVLQIVPEWEKNLGLYIILSLDRQEIQDCQHAIRERFRKCSLDSYRLGISTNWGREDKKRTLPSEMQEYLFSFVLGSKQQARDFMKKQYAYVTPAPEDLPLSQFHVQNRESHAEHSANVTEEQSHEEGSRNFIHMMPGYRQLEQYSRRNPSPRLQHDGLAHDGPVAQHDSALFQNDSFAAYPNPVIDQVDSAVAIEDEMPCYQNACITSANLADFIGKDDQSGYSSDDSGCCDMQYNSDNENSSDEELDKSPKEKIDDAHILSIRSSDIKIIQ